MPSVVSRFTSLHNLMLERARQGHLPYWRQLLEMSFLKFRHGMGVKYYQIAGFWQKDIPWSDKVAHLGEHEFNARLEQLNPMHYRKLSQHKLAEKALLTLMSVPTPRFLGYHHPTAGRTAAGEPLSNLAEFERFINSLSADRICFKLVEGMGGSGFIAVQLLRTGERILLQPLFSQETISIADFFQKHVLPEQHGRLIEEYIQQHETLASFNETSVNTLRVWAYAPAGQRGAIMGSYLRIGNPGSLVDNICAGGILAPVDNNGVTQQGLDGTPRRATFSRHPVSGKQIQGIQLPYWPEVQEVVAAALGAFPEMRMAGLDIAVSKTGPVVIEANNLPGLNGSAHMGLKLASILKP
jgi:hypothetical protein